MVCRGNLESLKEELKKVSKNSIDNNGASLLHWACFKKNLKIVDFLIDEGKSFLKKIKKTNF